MKWRESNLNTKTLRIDETSQITLLLLFGQKISDV